MDLWNSLAGMVEVELTSACVESALSAANEWDIVVFSVHKISGLTARFRILRRDYRALAELCRKRGDSLKQIRRKGIYWTGKRLISRPVFLFGIGLLIFLAMFLPTRVLFVRVEGNVSVPDNRILEAAEESGICFFASRREVRSEKMKNALLSEVPELQWAGVNTLGCVATISVRERTEPEEGKTDSACGNVVALRDGVITGCTATRGNLLCRPGQAVKEGQVLISGYSDLGICIRATGAEGEIYAQTNRELQVVTPSQWQIRGEPTTKKRNFSLIIGKKRINLWKGSGNSDGSCGRMYEEYYITLPGGFQLPVALAVEEYRFYESVLTQIEPNEAVLSDFGEKCLLEHMTAGSILGSSESLYYQDGVYVLEGTYVCEEMIGRFRQEQIGEYNGKSG